MARVLSSRADALGDQPAHVVIASRGTKIRAFLLWPFSIIIAMRPQREREAARIAAYFSAALDLRRGEISSVVDESHSVHALCQQRTANIGYLVFAFGFVWAIATAIGWDALPACKARGNISACSDAVALASKKPPIRLSVSRKGVLPSLASTRHGAHMR
jgi:hypothetical protein